MLFILFYLVRGKVMGGRAMAKGIYEHNYSSTWP